MWSGADLFNVTSAAGKRQMVVVENNSCPSGQKSMPLLDDNLEYGGYKRLIEESFIPNMKGKRLPAGSLAVVYDKNDTETTGYAAALADILNEPVYLIYYPTENIGQYLKINQGVLEFKDENNDWKPIRAVFRYLTQKPWNRLPVLGKTYIFNPIVACLAGGRNKMVASKAYDIYNGELQNSGMKVNTPETIWDVGKSEVPLWVAKMGGQAVIKNPYSNAGQGVYTIVNQKELDKFMALEEEYDVYIVQSLIGNYNWSSSTEKGKLYHVGTLPGKRGHSFAADIRMMVCSTPDGFKPLSVYSRRALKPMPTLLNDGQDSWEILGTNLSIKLAQGGWSSDTNRLMLMDRKDFNKIGVSLDDLIDGFIQTILSTIAIDKMAKGLINQKGQFRTKLFKSLNNDPAFLKEILG